MLQEYRAAFVGDSKTKRLGGRMSSTHEPESLISKPSTTCTFCGDEFPTRSALFRHLRKPADNCSAPRKDAGEKVMVLLGYDCLGREAGGGAREAGAEAAVTVTAGDPPRAVTGGDMAALLLLQAMGLLEAGEDSSRVLPAGFSQASSIGSRTCSLLAQEAGVSATADNVCLRAPTTVPLEGIRAWLVKINAQLEGTGVRLLGRMSALPELHAESHATRRRYEYILPAWLLDESAESPWLGPPRDQESLIPMMKRLRWRGLKSFGHCNSEHDGRRRPRPLWHNFSSSSAALPHSPSSARRLYRFFASLTIEMRSTNYVCLSVAGDAFVNQQVRGMVGLAVAASRGLISGEDIATCIDPKRQEDLLPIPLAPGSPCSLAEVNYMTWQTKLGGICMSPGTDQRLAPPLEGWSDEAARADAADFRRSVFDSAARWWEAQQWGRDWLHNVLQPGALKLRREIDAAKCRAENSGAYSGEIEPLPEGGPSLSEAPAVYSEVLRLLREADASGRWPLSTPARSLVISGGKEGTRPAGDCSAGRGRSGGEDGDEKKSTAAVLVDKAISEALEAPQSQQQQQQQQQPCGGSFTVGAFPSPCPPPRGNRLFPELTRAAFELEAALLPNRSPSTTIAINRHAKFKPHVDSGAGAGQSRSLIVGLGYYAGGELVVEGEEVDIRYRPLEFNGWTQRHWTRLFKGERYSLVWFTPRGCEGVTGEARFCSSAADAEEEFGGGDRVDE